MFHLICRRCSSHREPCINTGSTTGPYEVLEIPGYVDEKLKIARSYIIPEVLEDHGINDDHMEMSDEAIRFLIEAYTREAGVRTLKGEKVSLGGSQKWRAKHGLRKS